MMITGYVLLNLALALLAVWGRREALRFLEGRSAVSTAQDLDAFKALARRNMLVALAYIPLGLLSVIWSVLLIRQFHLLGVIIALAVNVPTLLLAQNLRKLEVRTRSLESHGDAIKAEYHRIG